MRADDEHLQALFAAMVDRRNVYVTADMKNQIGEVTKPAGWPTRIREIRRPAVHIDAYGHLDPVIVVEDDLDDPRRDRSLSILLKSTSVALEDPS